MDFAGPSALEAVVEKYENLLVVQTFSKLTPWQVCVLVSAMGASGSIGAILNNVKLFL